MSHSGQHQAAGAARTNVQKRRRKSHGLTIKIESPTTGEDSSAGIIDTSIMHSSASNIYLSGVSISRGHSPLSSPGPGPLTPLSPSRQGRSPSLSMPPASPLARNSRMRSASLAVAPGHRTPPHSPGDHSQPSNSRISPHSLNTQYKARKRLLFLLIEFYCAILLNKA